MRSWHCHKSSTYVCRRLCRSSSVVNRCIHTHTLPPLRLHSTSLQTTIIELLASDKSSAVRADAAGALRNLAIAGVDGAIPALVAANVVKAIVSAFPAAASQITRGEVEHAAPADGRRSEYSTMVAMVEQLGHLVAVLCEASVEAAAGISRTAVPAMALRCIGAGTLPASVLFALASCMQTLSEDNPTLGRLIHGSPDTLETLATLFEYVGDNRGETAAIRTAVAGICVNAGVTEAMRTATSALAETIGYRNTTQQ